MMHLKRYRNELIVLAALLLFAGGWFYKHQRAAQALQGARQTAQEIAELKRVIALKKLWGDIRIAKKVDSLKTIVSPSKITWQKQPKKLHTVFSGLNAQELNRVTTKILNLPVEIKLLKVRKQGNTYHMECICKW